MAGGSAAEGKSDSQKKRRLGELPIRRRWVWKSWCHSRKVCATVFSHRGKKGFLTGWCLSAIDEIQERWSTTRTWWPLTGKQDSFVSTIDNYQLSSGHTHSWPLWGRCQRDEHCVLSKHCQHAVSAQEIFVQWMHIVWVWREGKPSLLQSDSSHL